MWNMLLTETLVGKFNGGWDVVFVVQKAFSFHKCLLCSFFKKNTRGNDMEKLLNGNTSWQLQLVYAQAEDKKDNRRFHTTVRMTERW